MTKEQFDKEILRLKAFCGPSRWATIEKDHRFQKAFAAENLQECKNAALEISIQIVEGVYRPEKDENPN